MSLLSLFGETPAKPLVMDFYGDQQVLKNLYKKKELLEKKDKRQKYIRTALISPGGVQKGVVEGGVAIALQKMNLFSAFDDVIGVSAGSAIGYYTLVNEAIRGTSIYYDDNVNGHFINFERFWKIADIKNVEHVFRDVKPIDVHKLRNSRSHFWVGVTDADTGKGKFLYAKAFEDPTKCIIASMCLPIITGGASYTIHGERYIDGSLGNPLPLTFAIEELGVTDILVTLVYPLRKFKKMNKYVNAFLDKSVYRLLSSNVRAEIENYEDRYNKELEYITGERKVPRGVRIAAIYPREMPISRVDMNIEELKDAAHTAESFTKNLFRSIL